MIFLVNCEWSDWNMGTCSATCGKGNREKFRSKIVEEINGGACSGDSEATEDCNEKDCPGKSILAFLFIWNKIASSHFVYCLFNIYS